MSRTQFKRLANKINKLDEQLGKIKIEIAKEVYGDLYTRNLSDLIWDFAEHEIAKIVRTGKAEVHIDIKHLKNCRGIYINKFKKICKEKYGLSPSKKHELDRLFRKKYFPHPIHEQLENAINKLKAMKDKEIDNPDFSTKTAKKLYSRLMNSQIYLKEYIDKALDEKDYYDSLFLLFLGNKYGDFTSILLNNPKNKILINKIRMILQCRL